MVCSNIFFISLIFFYIARAKDNIANEFASLPHIALNRLNSPDVDTEMKCSFLEILNIVSNRGIFVHFFFNFYSLTFSPPVIIQQMFKAQWKEVLLFLKECEHEHLRALLVENLNRLIESKEILNEVYDISDMVDILLDVLQVSSERTQMEVVQILRRICAVPLPVHTMPTSLKSKRKKTHSLKKKGKRKLRSDSPQRKKDRIERESIIAQGRTY